MDNSAVKYYFLGIGGIGMSSLAKYLFDKGHQVMGYDKTPSTITSMLAAAGISILFEDKVALIPEEFNNDNTQVIYTPAIPTDNLQFNHFIEQGYLIKKRAVLLGEITKESTVFAIAGTHGKTTTASFLSHLFEAAELKFTAFLGGVLNAEKSNLIQKGTEYTIVEADEYDRSFLQLFPDYGCITAMDSDHLDIYGDQAEMEKAYTEFSKKVTEKLVVAEGLPLDGLNYAVGTEVEYFASNIRKDSGGYYFDFNTPDQTFKEVYLNAIGKHNLSNALGAAALMHAAGLNIEKALYGLAHFNGVNRRMEVFKLNEKTLIDDYAHHPEEIKAVFETVQSFFKIKTNKVIFQPHLYSRTKDFMDDFAKILSQFDQVVLMDIYPARELPIPGITSQALLDKIDNPNKRLISEKNFISTVEETGADLIVILGAGDIGVKVQKLKNKVLNEI
tara:strand:+ start:1095 stop:2432 length:1338 start_codon:yes stop_codon:yes gene_type:complete